MLSSILKEQLDVLLERYPGTTWTSLPQGGWVVSVPDVALKGWSKPSTTVYFVLPLGYPAAKPDCFLIDHDVRLINGTLPHAAAVQDVPGLGISGLWFSWHIESWNPNSSTVLNWMGVVRQRLQRLQ